MIVLEPHRHIKCNSNVHNFTDYYSIFSGIDVNFEHNLVGVDHNKSEATFTRSGNPEDTITMNVSDKNVTYFSDKKSIMAFYTYANTTD